ncbi:MAG: DUF3846 domain-containing protein [Oribacterium sp.]|nr:DUF3846 domain-containing protein [Oribacterium sp.]
MRVIVVEPDARPRVADIPSGLESLQSLVSGNIQVIYPYSDPVGIICNEEGKLLGLPLNRALRNDAGEIYDILSGTFIIAALTEDDFGDLTDEQIKKYTKLFHNKEVSVRKGQRILSFAV